jgi:hypothetical protein
MTSYRNESEQVSAVKERILVTLSLTPVYSSCHLGGFYCNVPLYEVKVHLGSLAYMLYNPPCLIPLSVKADATLSRNFRKYLNLPAQNSKLSKKEFIESAERIYKKNDLVEIIDFPDGYVVKFWYCIPEETYKFLKENYQSFYVKVNENRDNVQVLPLSEFKE